MWRMIAGEMGPWGKNEKDELLAVGMASWALRRGWNRRKQTMNPQMREAVENPGFG
jgi:hypothetical protein|tara:strand:+ start:246 stop:413 length:168 start_codon:yes stop_codon:yes gene_type:complete